MEYFKIENKKAVSSLNYGSSSEVPAGWVAKGSSDATLGWSWDGSIWIAPEDTRTYAEQRKAKYDTLNQFEMQFDDQANGTTTWVDAINDIKAEYPKN